MKKLLLYSFGTLLFMASCTKNENPKLPALAEIPPPLFTIDASGDATISAQTPDDFKGIFSVGLYYPTGTKPKKYDIVVEKDGDPTTVKTLMAGVTTLPTKITVTGTQLKALFGPIVLGNAFTIGADITTQDGKVYPAFPASGAAAFPAADFAAPGFNPTITFTAVCQFVMTDYGAIGSTAPFNVIADDWDPGIPYPVPATVPVTIVDATHFSFKYGPAQANVVITVNPVNNTTSVAKTVIGDYGAVLPYGNVTMNPSTSSENFVAPCDLAVSIYPEFTVSLGSFGNYQIELQKPGAKSDASVKKTTAITTHKLR